jgi:hypothetical protein
VTQNAMVRIKRQKAAWRDRGRAYQVIVDGDDVGRIGDDETKDFPVSPGTHTLKLKIDWTGSKEISFSVRHGEVRVFSSHPFSGPAIIALLRSIFQHDQWVILTDEGVHKT